MLLGISRKLGGWFISSFFLFKIYECDMKENCFDILFCVSWKVWKMIFCTPWNTIIFFSFISFESNVTVQMKIRIISNHARKHLEIILCFSLLFMISFTVHWQADIYSFVLFLRKPTKIKIKKFNKYWLLGWFIS